MNFGQLEVGVKFLHEMSVEKVWHIKCQRTWQSGTDAQKLPLFYLRYFVFFTYNILFFKGNGLTRRLITQQNET